MSCALHPNRNGRNLLNATKVSFHPNDNRASLVISRDDMLKFIEQVGNPYEIVDLYL